MQPSLVLHTSICLANYFPAHRNLSSPEVSKNPRVPKSRLNKLC
jgi:hypothetical protein